MRGAADRARRDGERDIARSHTTAALTRAKKLDELATYLPRRRPGRRGAMLDRLKAIAAATKDLG